MIRRYFQGTALAVYESEMMQVPNFERRGGGRLARPRIWYSKENLDCRNCADHSKNGCKHRCCPFLRDKLAVGAVTLAELADSCFKGGRDSSFRTRLRQHLAHNETLGFVDEHHRKRFASAGGWAWCGRESNPPEYAAALYLLTADIGLWWRAQNIVSREGIDFDGITLRGISMDGYAMAKEARELYNKRLGVTQDDLASVELIRDRLFGCVVTAILLSRYGVAVLCRTEETRC